MLFVGLQFMIWTISGAYMVILDIDYIHGDSLVTPHKMNSIKPSLVNFSINDLFTQYPNAKNIELNLLLNQAVYSFSIGSKQVLLNAKTGKIIPPITEGYAKKIAQSLYINKNNKILNTELLTDNAPSELSSRHLPVWRINFDDFASPTFYISAQTGILVTKRHSFWRIFDWMFSFHVMDYIEEDVSNNLLRVFAIISLISSLFGMVLTFNIFFNKRIPKKSSHKKKVYLDEAS